MSHLSDMTMPENSTNRKLKNSRNGEKRGISFIHLSHLCLQNFAFERNRVSARGAVHKLRRQDFENF